MKYCPNCQTTYTDDTLRFCLQDGTKLAEVADTQTDMPTVAFDDLETIVSTKQPQQVVPLNAPETRQNWQPNQQPHFNEPTRIVEQPIENRKSNTALTILATILVMMGIFGIGGAYFLLKSRKSDVVAVNVNTAPINRPLNINQANLQISNANLSRPTATPTAAPTETPSPKPTLEPKAVKAATNEVKDAIDDWKDASENLDIEGNLGQYADTIDYYNAGRVSREQVRADKERAFNQYDSINFHISNIKVTPDASGEKATAVFDKEWEFEGETKRSTGKVQQLLTLGKIGGRWLITGEKDLKTYYVGK